MSQARPAWRFPNDDSGVAVPAIHGLEMAMYATFGKPGAIRQAPDTPAYRIHGIERKMTILLAHNPMVSVRALKGG